MNNIRVSLSWQKGNSMARRKTAKREDGRIQKSFTYNGKRYFIYGYSSAELDDKYIQKMKQLEAGTENRINPTLYTYYETFTNNRRRKVKESTIRSQACQFNNCASIPVDANGKRLGDFRLADIRPDDIQIVQHTLAESGRTTETVNNSIDHLRHVFNQAVKSEYISRNPCDAVENLQRIEKPARETIHRALSKEETTAFFAAAADSFYINDFKLMIKTGLRIGEIGALMPLDVDTKEKTMHIHRTVTRDETGGYFIGDTPKTDAGTRDIPITDDIIKIIKDQRNLNRLVYSDKVEKQIFRSPENAILREYPVNREIKRICKKAGIEKFTCHAFRATFATRFIEQRPQDYKILSEILGHSNVRLTLNLYTHVMRDSKIKAMENIDIAI